jgi:hypothetical protein
MAMVGSSAISEYYPVAWRAKHHTWLLIVVFVGFVFYDFIELFYFGSKLAFTNIS